jgi:phage terminase large subunit-like protein
VREQERLFKATSILIEDNTSDTQLIQDLIEDRLTKVVRIAPEGDKIAWLHAQTATVENGFVHIPASAHWCTGARHCLLPRSWIRERHVIERSKSR